MLISSLLSCTAGQLRSADCVAMGQVTAVALSKRQFVEIDNPLLSWMLDYDAVASVLRVNPHALLRFNHRVSGSAQCHYVLCHFLM